MASNQLNTDATSDAQPLLQATYFTDPLCSWSWAFEPQWRRLQMEYAPWLKVQLRMGGLLVDWSRYADSVNDVMRPVQMGPLWFQMRTLSGMPCAERIWYEDPPASSYPACLAVKAAGLQGEEAATAMLRRLREAVMLEQRNIARREVLLEVAQELAHSLDAPGFADAPLEVALDGAAALDALRADLQSVTQHQVQRFPALLLRNTQSGQGVTLTGYRPYAALHEVLQRLAPEVQPSLCLDAATYVQQWRRTTARELAEVLAPGGITTEQLLSVTAQATAQLEKLLAQGDVEKAGDIYAWARA